MNTKEREESLTLEMLEAIEEQSDVTQRNLARQMNVALGLANSYLKRCVRKGWVKIHQAPANRYLYYLTPKGFAEKSRLTGQYLSISFSFYRKAGESCRVSLRQCHQQQWNRVILCGVSDLAEIALLRSIEYSVNVIALYDPSADRARLLNKPVITRLAPSDEFDVCLLTDLNDPQAMFERLLEEVPRERIVVPGILGLKLKR